MLAWLVERKIFSPTTSDPSTFVWKKQKKNKQKQNYFFLKKWILKGIPVEKLAMQNFIFTASIKYKFTYTTFLTAEYKQIWHNFINILLRSIIIIK